jgi:multiple antibiotic resistance protein
VLLFKVAFDMLQGKTSNTKLTADEEKESMSKDEIGVVPLGMPLLAGPGTITTTMIYFNLRSTGLEDKIMVFAAVILVIISAFIVLRSSTLLFKRLGRTGSMIISRVMGLLLAAIGVEFMANGIISIIHTI